MEQFEFELLEQIERGEQVFRPTDRSAEGRAEFQETVAHLLRLRGGGLIRLPDGKLMQAGDGSYLLAGPCDLTLAGVAAHATDRQLGPRPAKRGARAKSRGQRLIL